jgi:hypothetical protein
LDIRCRKAKCRFNDRFTCRAKEIVVGREVVCSTFERAENKPVQDVTKSLFEKPPCFAPQRDSKALSIKCRANCLFNHNGTCVSNGITLNSIEEKPFCVSYLKK